MAILFTKLRAQARPRIQRQAREAKCEQRVDFYVGACNFLVKPPRVLSVLGSVYCADYFRISRYWTWLARTRL